MESAKGNTYSNLEFPGDIVEDYSEQEFNADSKVGEEPAGFFAVLSVIKKICLGVHADGAKALWNIV